MNFYQFINSFLVNFSWFELKNLTGTLFKTKIIFFQKVIIIIRNRIGASLSVQSTGSKGNVVK